MWGFAVTGGPEHPHLEFLGRAMLTILLTMQSLCGAPDASSRGPDLTSSRTVTVIMNRGLET